LRFGIGGLFLKGNGMEWVCGLGLFLRGVKRGVGVFWGSTDAMQVRVTLPEGNFKDVGTQGYIWELLRLIIKGIVFFQALKFLGGIEDY